MKNEKASRATLHAKKMRRMRSLVSEDLQRLLEGFNLLLSTLGPLREANARVHTARFELIVVSERRVELLLRALEVFPRVFKVSRFGELQRFFLLGGSGLRINVSLRVRGKLIKSALRLRLAARRLLFEADEVRQDNLEHAEDALRRAAHASVRRVPRTRGLARRGRLLDKGGRGSCFGVEVLQHLQR